MPVVTRDNTCRSFLSPDSSGNGWDNIAKAKDYDGKPKYWGRFNIGVATVNLPYVALLSGGDEDKFWQLLDRYTEMCHTVNRIRAERLSKTEAGVAPILWCDGALARLDPHDTLNSLIHNDYATASLGYAGVYEAVKYLTGKGHYKEGKGKEFGLEIMKFLNAQCDKWKAEENIGYSLYGTPLENTTGTFAKAIARDFSKVEGINDRSYVTNSYHIPVFAHINAFDKLAIESKFQELSLGGWNQHNLL